MTDEQTTLKRGRELCDKITEPQEWIDGLISEYSPNAQDIDVALQNMGLKIAALCDELEGVETKANILFKYIDRLNDPTDSDPLEKIVGELVNDVAALFTKEKG